MKLFDNYLQVGQPAMIINVEYSRNSNMIGKVITINSLLTPEESSNIFENEGFLYASYINDNAEKFIRQNYLMPLPPLGDVYNQEVSEELENLKVKNYG